MDKNKLAPPFREAEIDILYGKGVDREGEVVDLAMDAGIIKKSGSWFALNDQQLGQGRSAACQWLSEHPEVREKLAAHLIERAKRAAAGGSKPEGEAAGKETGAIAKDGKASQAKAA